MGARTDLRPVPGRGRRQSRVPAVLGRTRTSYPLATGGHASALHPEQDPELIRHDGAHRLNPEPDYGRRPGSASGSARSPRTGALIRFRPPGASGEAEPGRSRPARRLTAAAGSPGPAIMNPGGLKPSCPDIFARYITAGGDPVSRTSARPRGPGSTTVATGQGVPLASRQVPEGRLTTCRGRRLRFLTEARPVRRCLPQDYRADVFRVLGFPSASRRSRASTVRRVRPVAT